MLRLSRSVGIVEVPRSARAFFSVVALLFAGSAAATIAWSTSMPAMGGMPMPGGWSMSMAWMRMPGQSWPAAIAAFLGMWMVMMVAMMLPSLVPMLWRYRHVIGADGPRLGRLTALVSAGYFAVWGTFGLVVYPLGTALATIEMRVPALARGVPLLTAAVVLAAGAVQFTAWKARQLACCRMAPRRGVGRPDTASAWRHGMRLGVHCCACCANLTAVLLAVGVMDLRAMTAVMAAITAERLAPANVGAARIVGVATSGAGLLLLAQAAGLG